MNNPIIPQTEAIEHPPEHPTSPLKGGIEGGSFSAGPIPQRRGQRHPPECDPGRRLIAAVACQAVIDIIRPRKDLTPRDIHTARQFITENQEIYLALGIPAAKLKTLVSAS
jgi:hypothetical protein